MTKDKNLKYLRTYRKQLVSAINGIEEKIARLQMKRAKHKEDLTDVRAIIKDLEIPDGI